ncbi:FAD-linked sulfhydryl oxidase ALR [Cephus cinctus]|uniref:Sulfhydryl oxidase n=1 Tax=Cephus cinctus TaxID=211228 RepID=A0AAJ7BJ55_CEPCN|nr:FAD-linked sulfhydryl oxidase ALR [Cephus cinctus]XP_024937047.1 FAD-linked sulfhydryl oxidase ALR [Cephus cinctus]
MSYEKPCRTCTDFKTWAKIQKQTFDSEKERQKQVTESTETAKRKNCPLDKDELGSSTWAFLHTMAAYYPSNPTNEQRKDMKTFFYLFSKFYPCNTCAEDFQGELKTSPPRTDSQEQLSQWLCEMHNIVNRKLDKPEFDCKLVNQRWRDGWLDGSCD